jgi:uncharacterized protein Yka (UPF0111/DUF47 family)
MRLVAQDVVQHQAEVCAVKLDNFNESLRATVETTRANAKAITDLAQTVAVMAAAVVPMSADVKEHDREIDQLKRKPIIASLIVAAIPTLLTLLLFLWLNFK